METTGALIRRCQFICNKYESKIPNMPKDELFYQLCDDTIRMGFLIAVSDGYVDVQEIEHINRTFGVRFDYNFMARSYGLDYISEESFMKQIPISIRTIAELEKKDNPDPYCFLDDTRVLYATMKQFGDEMLNCTGARLNFVVMIQNYFINNVLNYIFKMEELDAFSGNQLDEAMTSTLNNFTRKEANGGIMSVSAPNLGAPADINGIKLKEEPAKENLRTIDNSIQEFQNKVDVEKNLEDCRGDMNIAAEQPIVFGQGIRGGTGDSEKSVHRSTTAIGTGSSVKSTDGTPIDMDTIHEILGEVDNLIGLGNVKKEIHDMVNMMLINEMRRRKGLKNPVVSRHLVFTGNPGTGKTTIARAIGKIYKTLGILEKGHMIETDRSGMVAGYMGQTAEKVTEVVKTAMGGILFIDEAYSLVSDNEGDYGQEAINTLLKLMEDNRDSLVVIVAGYTEEMESFINSNPGLRSRFNRYIQFNDYTDDELLQIFKQYVDEQDYKLEDDIDGVIMDAIRSIHASEGDNFGNARSMRNYFEKVISNQANRLIDVGAAELDDTDELMIIKKEDFKI